MIHLPKSGWFCSFEKCQHLMDSTSVWEQRTEEGAHLPCGCPHKLGFSGDGSLMIGVDFFFFFSLVMFVVESLYWILQFTHCIVFMLNHLRHVWFFVTPWTVALQGPLSLGFTRQEYWSGLLCTPPGDLPDQASNLGLLRCRWILYHCDTWEAKIRRPNRDYRIAQLKML